MSLTLATILDDIQDRMDDDGTRFPDADLTPYLYDAIREYSQHFPRVQTVTLTCLDDRHYYTVPADGIGVLQVEYPKGEDPPQYLDRLSRRSPNFWADDGYYDVEMEGDGGGLLWLSAGTAGGETIELTYSAHHDTDLAAGDNLSVPEEHLPIIIANVIWKCYLDLLAEEVQNPDTTIHLIRDMQEVCTEARLAYERALARALGAAGRSAMTKGWVMDGYDPIY